MLKKIIIMARYEVFSSENLPIVIIADDISIDSDKVILVQNDCNKPHIVAVFTNPVSVVRIEKK